MKNLKTQDVFKKHEPAQINPINLAIMMDYVAEAVRDYDRDTNGRISRMLEGNVKKAES